MRDYITLGATPAEEPCAQMGSDNYHQLARKESEVYIGQLKRELNPKLQLGIKQFPHDFGTYMEVVAYFDNDNEEQVAEALRLENNLPGRWDERSRVFLNIQDKCYFPVEIFLIEAGEKRTINTPEELPINTAFRVLTTSGGKHV